LRGGDLRHSDPMKGESCYIKPTFLCPAGEIAGAPPLPLMDGFVVLVPAAVDRPWTTYSGDFLRVVS